MRKKMSRELEETLSLYIDGRLGSTERAAFERLMQADRELREVVEFHRGLALEFHEEAPPLPRGYAERAHARLERALAAGPRRAIPWWRRSMIPLAAGLAVAILAAILMPRILRRPSAEQIAVQPPPRAGGTVAEADQQTLEALRSLGYIGSREANPPPGVAKAAPKSKTMPRSQSIPGLQTTPGSRSAANRSTRARASRAAPTPGPVSGYAASQPPMVAARPEPEAVPTPAAPTPAATPAVALEENAEKTARSDAADAVPFRIVPLPKGPEPGSDHLEIRSEEAWAPFAPLLAETPGIAFDKEMVIVLRDDLQSDPPSRLRVVAVRASPEAVVVECRVERLDSQATGAPPAAGQGVIIANRAIPARVIIR